MKSIALFALCVIIWASPASAAVRVCNVQGPETATCRETLVTLISGDARQEAKGVACQQPTASWLVVSGPGYGTSFNTRDATMPYLGPGAMINNVYHAPPDKIRFIVTDMSVCVPALPRDLQPTRVIIQNLQTGTSTGTGQIVQ